MITGTRRLPGEGGWLLAAWRADPSAEATKRLCDWLAHHRDRFTFPTEALDEIATHAISQHADDIGVLLAVGRLVLAYGDREDALRFMVLAAQLAGERETVPPSSEGEPDARVESPSRIRTAFAILDDPETWDVVPSDRLVG